MSFWMSLRVVKDRKVALQVCGVERRLAGKRVIGAEAATSLSR
jgi:hypothetical protein